MIFHHQPPYHAYWLQIPIVRDFPDGPGAKNLPCLIHADVWQKPTQYCKAIILQFKINKQCLNENKKTWTTGGWSLLDGSE